MVYARVGACERGCERAAATSRYDTFVCLGELVRRKDKIVGGFFNCEKCKESLLYDTRIA